jgi:Tol biopolymer transport system component
MTEVPQREGSPADPIVQVGGDNIVYRPVSTRPVQISWYSRQGVPLAHVAGEPLVGYPEISPDGKRAVVIGVAGGENWLVDVDLETGAVQRLTSMELNNTWPLWSAGGKELLYTSRDKDTIEIRAMDPATPSDNRLVAIPSLAPGREVIPEFDASDGRGLFVDELVPGHWFDIMILDRKNGFTPRPLVATKADEIGAALVDGGRRIVYASNATGRYELYLADVAAPQRPVRLTRDGCQDFGFNRHPVWAIGDELYYCSIDGQTLRSLQLVHAGDKWQAREDRALFALPPGFRGICPSPDGSRFLVLTNDRSQAVPMLSLVQGWRSELK